MRNVRLQTAVVILLAIIFGTGAANAQSVEDFYRGRSLKLLVSAAVGGGADLYARVFARHFGKHIPGRPTFVVQNVPGAAGLLLAGQMQNTAPRDGSVIAVLQRNNLAEPLIADHDIGFDPRRLNWLGSLNKDTYVIVAWHTAAVKTIEDALARELVLGNTGGGTENVTFPLLLNKTLGTKFKLVRGYKGSDEVALAIERGEVQGRAITWTTMRSDHASWLAERKVNLLIQLAMRRHPDLPTVPSVLDYVRDPSDRQLLELMFAPLEAGRPIALPPGTPPDRLAALRAAFIDLAKDPAFLADIGSHGSSVEPLAGHDTQTLVENLYRTPREILSRAREIRSQR
jgi:tripartite-type tricarboxylate transporter receptor subunit TctC